MTRETANQWVNVKQAARELDVSTHVIYRAVHAGTLPAIQVTPRGTIRIPRSALKVRP